MSIETKEQRLEVNETDAAITEAENESEQGLIETREALATSRRKHFG